MARVMNANCSSAGVLGWRRRDARRSSAKVSTSPSVLGAASARSWTSDFVSFKRPERLLERVGLRGVAERALPGLIELRLRLAPIVWGPGS